MPCQPIDTERHRSPSFRKASLQFLRVASPVGIIARTEFQVSNIAAPSGCCRSSRSPIRCCRTSMSRTMDMHAAFVVLQTATRIWRIYTSKLLLLHTLATCCKAHGPHRRFMRPHPHPCCCLQNMLAAWLMLATLDGV